MALVTCRECEAAVSTDANRCPSCGVKYPTEQALARDASRGNWYFIAIAVLVVALVAGAMLYRHHQQVQDDKRRLCEFEKSLGSPC